MKFVKQKKALENFRKAHQELKNLLKGRSEEDLTVRKIHDDWTIKDVVAHLAGWNIETLAEINRILSDNPEWPGKFEDSLGEGQYEDFNAKNVELRKSNSWKEVYDEWEDTFNKLIDRAEGLTNEEWSHHVGDGVWLDKTPVTVYSLFTYEYENQGHEGDHLKQIREFLK